MIDIDLQYRVAFYIYRLLVMDSVVVQFGGTGILSFLVPKILTTWAHKNRVICEMLQLSPGPAIES